MGCDIHMHTERLVGGTWRHHGTGPYDDRNYEAFAVLAGVRNQYGIRPISEPRGIPANVSPETAEALAEWSGSAHSMSWLMLAELQAYDWASVIRCDGIVREPVYVAWKAAGGGQPTEWSQSCGGQIDVCTPSEMDRRVEQRRLNPEFAAMLDEIPARFGHRPLDRMTVVTWETPLVVECSGLLVAVRKLDELGPPDAVRIVFWFDS